MDEFFPDWDIPPPPEDPSPPKAEPKGRDAWVRLGYEKGWRDPDGTLRPPPEPKPIYRRDR